MIDCIFCNKRENIVFNTDNFYIKIGKGIICDGHCMIIPNKHYTCIAESCVNFMDEFLFLKEKLIQFLSNNFYKPFVVEHGAVKQSVFHGHMHFIPLKSKEYNEISVMNEMIVPTIKNSNLIYEKISNFNELLDIFNEDKRYIYFEENKEIYVLRPNKNEELFNKVWDDLNYRYFFTNKVGLKGVKSWKEMTDEDIINDNIKIKNTTEIFKNFADFYHGK